MIVHLFRVLSMGANTTVFYTAFWEFYKDVHIGFTMLLANYLGAPQSTTFTDAWEFHIGLSNQLFIFGDSSVLFLCVTGGVGGGSIQNGRGCKTADVWVLRKSTTL
jgi:hypothetical protein